MCLSVCVCVREREREREAHVIIFFEDVINGYYRRVVFVAFHKSVAVLILLSSCE